MVNYAGQNAFILVDKESTFNTAVTTPSKDLGVTSSVSDSLSNNLIQIDDLGDREAFDLIAGNFSGTVTVDGDLNSGAMLELFFGQSTDTETTGDYRHTFVDRGTLDILNNIDSFTFMENLDSTSDITQKFSGCKTNSVDIAVNINESVTISSEVIVSSVATGTTAGTKVTTTTKPLVFQNCTLSFGDEGSETTVTQVQSFSISWNNNIDDSEVRGLGSRENQELIPKGLTTEGEFTVKVTDKTILERFLGGTSPIATTPTKSGLIFDANNGVALGSGKIDFYTKLLGVMIEEKSEAIEVDGVVEQTFTFKATNVDDCYMTDAVDSYF
jgi:hypothetical protein